MKAGVVGVGKLGGAIAYALAHRIPWDELVLTDVVEGMAWAQAEDIRDGLDGRSSMVVRAGTLDDLRDADVVVLCAGQGRKPGMTRLDLLHANTGLVADLGRSIARTAPRAALVVLTNPVDVMTTVAWRASGLPRERILGSGALLDSTRLRTLLADRFQVPLADVDAVVLGEHGDRAVPVFSRTRIRGKPIDLPPSERAAITEALRTLSAKIIEIKGGTMFGPAGCTATLVSALVSDEPSLVPASVVLRGEYGLRDVAVGVPAVLGQGRCLRVEEWELRSEEQAALQHAGHGLAQFAEDAAVVLGLAAKQTSLERLTTSANR